MTIEAMNRVFIGRRRRRLDEQIKGNDSDRDNMREMRESEVASSIERTIDHSME